MRPGARFIVLAIVAILLAYAGWMLSTNAPRVRSDATTVADQQLSTAQNVLKAAQDAKAAADAGRAATAGDRTKKAAALAAVNLAAAQRAVATAQVNANAARDAQSRVSSSYYFGWFGLLAVAFLWLISAVLAGAWHPFALAMGMDNRLSTSKMQALLWTACVGFVYAMIYSDRVITLGHTDPIHTVPENVLFALGLSATAVVAAKAITSSQVSANPDNKDVISAPSYDPAALVRDDGAQTASLTKVQMLFWTVVAIVVYLVTSFHQLGVTSICATGTCSLPDIDTTLMLFMGLGHATYIGGKLAASSTPTLSSVSDADSADGKLVTLTGSNLGSAGCILLNGDVVDAQIVAWTPTKVSFVYPKDAPGNPAPSGKVAIAVTIGGVASPPITYSTGTATQVAPPNQPPFTKTGGSPVVTPLSPPPAPAAPPRSLQPATARAFGIDVSYAQDRIDWDAVKANNLAQFVYSRASDGTNPANDDGEIFRRNHDECKRLNIPFGAYHFFRFTQDGPAQAAHFLEQIDGRYGDLRAMVDVESTNPGPSLHQMIANLSSFIAVVEKALEAPVIVYTAQYIWNSTMGGTDAFAGHQLWVANYTYDPNASPAMPNGWSDWTIFQYSDKGHTPLLPGSSGSRTMDLDVLKGDISAIARRGSPLHAMSTIASPPATELKTVTYDGSTKRLKAFAANGSQIFECEAHNDSVAANAWRPGAGCPPGTYALSAPLSNDTSKPSADGNDWVGEGRFFVPITGIKGHDGIGIHGGGSCAVRPGGQDTDALAPQQPWCPTENCIRLHNDDLEAFVRLPLDGKTIVVAQPA